MASKSLVKSKTFWVNVLMAVASVAGEGYGIPAKVAVPIAAIANIVLRLISSKPVTVLPS